MRSDASRSALTHHPLKDSIKLASKIFPQSLQLVGQGGGGEEREMSFYLAN
jgi:hypothetical protein